jgi:hypothetical protein
MIFEFWIFPIESKLEADLFLPMVNCQHLARYCYLIADSIARVSINLDLKSVE